MGSELPWVMTLLAGASATWWIVDGVIGLESAQRDYDRANARADPMAVGQARIDLERADAKRSRLAVLSGGLAIAAGLSWGAYAIWGKTAGPASADTKPRASAALRVDVLLTGVSVAGAF